MGSNSAELVSVLRNVKTAGAAGDGVTLDTAAFLAASRDAAGKPIYVPDGTYIVDVCDFTALTRLVLAEGATIKLKDSATMTGSILAPIIFRNSFSSIEGGTVDANRAGQDRAAFNAAGGGNARKYYGVYFLGTSGARLFGNRVRTKITNAMDFGFYATYCDEGDFHVTLEDCGAGAAFVQVRKSRIERIRAKGLDNNDAEIFPHALDITFCEALTGGDIQILDQTGYDTASGNSLSDWFSGITILNSSDLDLHGISWSALADTAATKSVGMSLLGVEDSILTGVNLRRAVDVALELGGCVNTKIIGFTIDNEYQTSSIFPAVFSTGVGMWNNDFYDDFASRARRQNTRCTLANGTITRCLISGWQLKGASGCTFTNVKTFGNRDGLFCQTQEVDSSFTGITDQDCLENKFEACDFSFNERYGVFDGGSTDMRFIGCNMNNNGQSKTTAVPGTLRNGSAFAGNSAGYISTNNVPVDARTRTTLVGCLTEDTQTNTTANGSADPASPRVVSVDTPNLYTVGQTITLVGCGPASADLVCQIRSIDKDELTIDQDISTFPVVAGTGTITTVGTAVTGAGSAFSTQMQGRTWIKHGTNYRRIVKVTSSTAAVLESAFPADLAAQAFDIVQFDARQIACQDYGIEGDNSNTVELITVGHSFGAGGHVVNNVLYGSGAEMTIGVAGMALPMVFTLGDFSILAGTPAIGLNSDSKRTLWLFDAAGTESIQAVIDIPAGAPQKLRLRIRWTNNGAGAGDVFWAAGVLFNADGGAITTGDSGVAGQAIAAPAQNVAKWSTLAVFSVTEKTTLFLRITREGAQVGDTLANDAGIIAVSLEAN